MLGPGLGHQKYSDEQKLVPILKNFTRLLEKNIDKQAITLGCESTVTWMKKCYNLT